MTLSIPTALLLSLLLPLLLLLRRRLQTKSKSNVPPGPPPLPVIGNLHQLGPVAHRSLHGLSKVHGPIFQLNLGRVPALVVSSPSLAEQVLRTHDHACCSRPPVVSFREYSYNGLDVAAAPYGDRWRNLRRIFVLQLLSPKNLHAFRSAREEEIETMISSIRTSSDPNSPVNISDLTARLAHNIIFQVAFGYRSEGEYGEKSKFHRILEVGSATVASFYAADYFPGFGWVDELTGQMRRLRRNTRELDEFYREVIGHHLKDERKEDLQEDIVDVLLRLWREEELSMDQVKGALMNIFVAGTDTTSATLTWAMAELARNQTVMRKAQAEVRGVIGKKGNVQESDLPRLQYVKFVANETLRLHPPLPLLIPRETMNYCEIGGYDVRPKTRVLVNVWAIGRDGDAWEKPEEFDPDRFAGSSVDYRGHCFQFLPFGAGRRVCPGIQFGAATVELALANMLYSFDWELPQGTEVEDIDMCEAPGLVTHKKTALSLLASNYYHQDDAN